MAEKECVFRALHPERMFERSDGTISPAAFKDSKGLSVEINLDRTDSEVVASLMSYLSGNVVKISTKTCDNAEIEIFDDKSRNRFHRLLLDANRLDENNYRLTNKQALYLSQNFEEIIHT